MGKNVLAYRKRLEAIDDCLRQFAKPMNIRQITDKCNRELGVHITTRQYKYDIDAIEDIDSNATIRVEKIDGKKTYVYANEGFSIKGETEYGQVEMLNLRKIKNALTQFSGLNLDSNLNEVTDEIDKILGYDKKDKAVISFEKTVLESHGKKKPGELLKDIFTAIIQHQPLDIKYEVPGRGKRDWVVFPQFLKQYNQRWYLIALIHRKGDKLQNIALDRILSIEPNQHIPYKQSDIDFAAYFEDVVGVTRPEGAEPIEVKLRIEKSEYPYIESKPIHSSQDELFEEDENYVYLSLYVYNNYEFRSKLLSYGSKVTVMAPTSLRDKLSSELQKAFENYDDK